MLRLKMGMLWCFAMRMAMAVPPESCASGVQQTMALTGVSRLGPSTIAALRAWRRRVYGLQRSQAGCREAASLVHRSFCSGVKITVLASRSCLG